LIGGAPYGQSAKAHDFESAERHLAALIGGFESFQDYIDVHGFLYLGKFLLVILQPAPTSCKVIVKRNPAGDSRMTHTPLHKLAANDGVLSARKTRTKVMRFIATSSVSAPVPSL
jgi:hypothetical protein